MALLSAGFQGPARGAASCDGGSAKTLSGLVGQGDFVLLCTFDEVFASQGCISCAFLVSIEIHGDGSVLQVAEFVQRFEAGKHQHISSLHVVGSLAGGGAVIEPGEGGKGHVLFKNGVQVANQK